MSVNIFKDEFLRCLMCRKTEVVEDQLKHNNFKMILNVELNNEVEVPVYHLIEPKDEHSKIKFLHYNEFPDGVFIKKLSEHEYKIYVIEIKRDITKHLDKIPKQLHSGILHAISVIKMSEAQIDFNKNTIFENQEIKIDYELIVCSGKKVLYSTPKKVIPGKPVESNVLLKLLRDSNKVRHNLKGKELVELPVKVVILEETVGDNGKEFYEGSILLA
ncbi:hypothetical protein LF864_05790 [Enterococcus faecalis]|uniref:hypothetical protein n=1 Tax=Enterococcus TaxID=1350 RepID=UPI0005357D14|nr:hypothetical protein [Enterococcus faecalis]EGO7983701.1 hypothetical protein [Enterococcus faecalis]EGO8075918.1 hypothetical protein [Enterococcus faecalis]EGO8500492.1 hypothetical protein [Enterococcus faecalis]EGS8257510.1 hypothetical protein [Enterococcus faecalis]EHS2294364.1 hypothetical protein [Enterococcus faecalis]